MGWLRDRYDTIKEAAGIRWPILGILVSMAIARLDWLYQQISKPLSLPTGSDHMIFGVPSWAWGLIFFIAFMGYFLLEYTVKLRKQIRGARAELAELRTEGVTIRNDGMQIPDEKEWIAWEQCALEWHQRVHTNLKKISEADAEWFRVLDVVPEPRVGCIPRNKEHEKLFAEHDYRIKRLGEMVYNLWRGDVSYTGGVKKAQA